MKALFTGLGMAAICVLTASSVQAGSLEGTSDSFLMGDRAALMGGAVVAISGASDAAWYNPAGLGAVSGSSINVSASAFMIRLRNVSELLVHELPNGERKAADLGSHEFLSVPSSMVAVWKMHETFSLALGFFMPRSDFMVSDNGLSLFATDDTGDILEFHDQISDTFRWEQMQAGISVGWAILEWFRLGASLNVVYDTVSWGYRMLWQSKASDDDEELWSSSGTELLYSEARSFGLQASLGLQFELGHGLHLGMVMRSPVMECYAIYVDSLLQSSVDAESEFGAYSDFYEETEEMSGFDLGWISPLRLHLALAYALEDGWISLEGDVSIPVVAVDYGMLSQWAWNVKAGAEFPIMEDVRVGFGFFTDRSAASQVDALHDSQVHFFGFTAGASYDTAYQLVSEEPEDASAGEILTLSTTIALRYALGLGDYGTEWHDPAEIDWAFRKQSVVFHEFSLHLGSGISF